MGPIPRLRGAAKFYLDRLADPNLLTRNIGRMFLGRDFQCAQCHDHPLIDDNKQADLLRDLRLPEPDDLV